MSVNNAEKYRFEFESQGFPSLSENVFFINHNLVGKKLQLMVWETKSLDVYRWMAHLEKTNRDMSKSSFMNDGKTSAEVYLLDDRNSKYAVFRLRKLSAISHSCQFTKIDVGRLVHVIDFEYESVDFALIDK